MVVVQAKRVNVVTDESEQEFGGVMLELDLLEDSGQLMGTLGYNTDLFKESTVIRIAQQFQVCCSLTRCPRTHSSSVALEQSLPCWLQQLRPGRMAVWPLLGSLDCSPRPQRCRLGSCKFLVVLQDHDWVILVSVMLLCHRAGRGKPGAAMCRRCWRRSCSPGRRRPWRGCQ